MISKAQSCRDVELYSKRSDGGFVTPLKTKQVEVLLTELMKHKYDEYRFMIEKLTQ